MADGTFIVSRAVELHPEIKDYYEGLGFKNITVTASEKDGLDRLIEQEDPSLLIMDCNFYDAGTPYMMGQLIKNHPDLNTAVFSETGYPLCLAVYFIWYGVNSYVNLWEGRKEFEKGLKQVCEGKKYISPKLQNIINNYEEPDLDSNLTKRLMECLIMLCCGFKNKRIGDRINISKKTVENHLQRLYDTFNVSSREEMASVAYRLKLVTEDDMKFYNDRTFDNPLPYWAKIRIAMNKQMEKEKYKN